MARQAIRRVCNGVNGVLDRHVIRLPVLAMTSAPVIVFTFALLPPLVAFRDSLVFVLLANSYLNVSSAGVSMAVLRQQLQAEQASRGRAEAAEKRAQEDHRHILEMHKQLMDELDWMHRMLPWNDGLTPESRVRIKPELLHPRGVARFAADDHIAVLNGDKDA